MRPAMTPRLVANLMALALLQAPAIAADKPFTGSFQGQGRGCWGKLYVKTRTIEWNTPYSVCAKTTYAIIGKDLDSASPRIAFALDRRSKSCRYTVVELSFDPAYPDYWHARGFVSRTDYDSREKPDEGVRLRTLSCGVQRED